MKLRPTHRLTYLLTRVKSRDASASKKSVIATFAWLATKVRISTSQMCPLKQLRAPTMAVVAVRLMDRGWLWRAGKLFQVIIVLQWCYHFSVMRHGYKSTIYLNKNWQQFRQQRAIWMSILVLVHLSWAIYVFLISFLVWQWHQKNHYQSRGVAKNGLFTALTVSKCENLYPFYPFFIETWFFDTQKTFYIIVRGLENGFFMPLTPLLYWYLTVLWQSSSGSKEEVGILVADSVQTEYCTTFLLSVCSFVCHRRDISHFSHI